MLRQPNRIGLFDQFVQNWQIPQPRGQRLGIQHLDAFVSCQLIHTWELIHDLS